MEPQAVRDRRWIARKKNKFVCFLFISFNPPAQCNTDSSALPWHVWIYIIMREICFLIMKLKARKNSWIINFQLHCLSFSSIVEFIARLFAHVVPHLVNYTAITRSMTIRVLDEIACETIIDFMIDRHFLNIFSYFLRLLTTEWDAIGGPNSLITHSSWGTQQFEAPFTSVWRHRSIT